MLAGGVGALGRLRRGRSHRRSCEPCARSNEVLFPPQTKFRVKEDLTSSANAARKGRKCFRESFPVTCELACLQTRASCVELPTALSPARRRMCNVSPRTMRPATSTRVCWRHPELDLQINLHCWFLLAARLWNCPCQPVPKSGQDTR